MDLSLLSLNELFDEIDKTLSNSSTLFEIEENQISTISRYIVTLSDITIAIGDTCSNAIKALDEPSNTEYVVLYSWIEKSKRYLILCRNIIIEIQKASFLLEENRISKEDQIELVSKAESVILEAVEDVKVSNIHDEAANQVNISKSIKKWKHQDIPWDIYRDQFLSIKSQCLELENLSQKINIAIDVFTKIGDEINELPKTLIKSINHLENKIKESFSNIPEEGLTEKRVGEIMEFLSLDESTDREIFADKINGLLEILPQNYKYTIGANEGILLYKEIDIQKKTSLWLDSEIYPKIEKAFYSYENTKNKLNLSKLNILNKLGFHKKENQKTRLYTTPTAFETLIKSFHKLETEYIHLSENLKKGIDAELLACNIYKERFLPVSVSSSFSQYKKYRVHGWRRFQEWYEAKGKYIGRIKKDAKREESLSLSEKIVRVVQFSSPSQELSDYTNMFITSGYIGDSFAVGRNAEMERIHNLVENWKAGFRGTLLISGERFSGKTFLGTMVQHRYFKNKTISLKPNQILRLEGRRLEVSYDIKEVLEFIVKYGLQKQYMVWVDDLILWQNDKISIATNVKHLLQFMDTYSGKLFFMVAMSNILKEKLSLSLGISKIFQCEAHLKEMPFIEAKDALLIRHNATQYNMLDETGKELTPNQIDRVIRRLYYLSGGNIGSMLRKWSYYASRVEDDTITIKKERNYSMPQFLNIETAIFLRTIILNRNINEFMLLRNFGPAFQEIFKPIKNRLLGVGILKRNFDGTIEVNPFLVNEIEDMVMEEFHLSKKGFSLNKTQL